MQTVVPNKKQKFVTPDKFTDKTIVITGSLGPGMTRDKAKAVVKTWPNTEFLQKMPKITGLNKGEILVLLGIHNATKGESVYGDDKRQVAKDNKLNCMEAEEFEKLIKPYI